MNAVGIIFSNIHDNALSELTRDRTVASLPFAARYRQIDFILSNMSNSGVQKIGIITKYNYRSLMDHLGSCAEWDLNLKNNGLVILAPYASSHSGIYRGKLEALANSIDYLTYSDAEYIMFADTAAFYPVQKDVDYIKVPVVSTVKRDYDRVAIVGRAIKKGLVEIHIHNLRKYGKGPRQQVDDYSYGGDAGMVLMLEPVYNMIQELKAEREYDEVIYMSPDGEILNQNIANELSLKGNIIILCGHYKGIDHRIREHLITREISCGDYVLSGGELPAAILADSIIRLIPGALSDETSALSDSFQDGLLSPPVYTRPAEFNGWTVPEVLLSGNPKLIRAWQDEQAIERTKKLRPGLLSED